MSQDETDNQNMEVVADENELVFPPTGGTQTLLVSNHGEQKVAIKIKVSNVTLYRANPVYALLEPDEPIQIDVVREAGDAKEDVLVVQYKESDVDDRTAQDAFQRTDTEPCELRIALTTSTSPVPF